MFATKILVSLFEFIFTVLLAVGVVYVNYQVYGKVNIDYDEEEELKKGNLAIAVLLASIMFASSMIVMKSIYPVVSLMRLYMTSPLDNELSLWQLIVYGLAHLVMSFVLAVLTISFSLRLYGKLTVNIQEGQELKRGNVAIGIVLSSVVLIVSMIVGEGISSLTKAMIPQPSIGRVKVLK